jgi:putative hydrolase of the HAD superfamily
MGTVLIVPEAEKPHGAEAWELAGHDDPHIDHVADDIAVFIEGILADGRRT